MKESIEKDDIIVFYADTLDPQDRVPGVDDKPFVCGKRFDNLAAVSAWAAESNVKLINCVVLKNGKVLRTKALQNAANKLSSAAQRTAEEERHSASEALREAFALVSGSLSDVHVQVLNQALGKIGFAAVERPKLGDKLKAMRRGKGSRTPK